MIVRWTLAARNDLVALRAYIAEDNPSAAASTAQKILTSSDRLADFPNMGRSGALPYTRELTISGTPYFMVYRVADEQIEILRVMHSSRQWPLSK